MAVIPSTLVALRNDSGSTITMGTLSILASGVSTIWDTVTYAVGISANFAQVLADIAPFNIGIENGDLVMVQDTVDLSSTDAWALFHVLAQLFYSEGIAQNGFNSLIAQLPPATQVGDHLVSFDGSTFSVVQPVVGSEDGWLSNQDGELLVEGVGL